MVKEFEDIIKEFKKLGYDCDYYPSSHLFQLCNSVSGDGFLIKYIHIYYRRKYIRIDGGFDAKELNLIKKIVERLEEK